MPTTKMVSYTTSCVVCGNEFSGMVRQCSPPSKTCSKACRRTLTLASREQRKADGTSQPHVMKGERRAKIGPVVCQPDPPDYRSWRTREALAQLPADFRQRIEP